MTSRAAAGDGRVKAGTAPSERARNSRRVLRKWHAAAVVSLLAAIGAGLAAYAAAASYESVSAAAVAHHVPLASLNPLGLDGGLFGIVVLDIVLTWTKQPVWWLRLTARLFAGGTIAANAAAGWPDPVGTGLRIAAPALFVLLVEVARFVLLRRNRAERPGGERIPAARWLLAPWPTFVLWRRMKLWRIRDYRTAVDIELSRRQAIVRLTVRYAGKDWRKAAPADVVWMLRNGVRMDGALARVAELTAPPPVPEPAAKPGPRDRSARSAKTGPGARGTARRTGPADDLTMEARTLALLAGNPEMTGAEIARRLGVKDSYGRKLKRRLAGQDRSGPAVPDRPPDRRQDRTAGPGGA